MALPNIPPAIAPFTVVEYFPDPDVSGYHDPVTARFVDRTALVRKRRKMPDRCFERERDETAPLRATTPAQD